MDNRRPQSERGDALAVAEAKCYNQRILVAYSHELVMAGLPTGTVTLLFTDIEGLTHLLQRLGSRSGEVLAEYRTLLRSIFQAHGGQEIDTQGDSFFVAFPRALDAVLAAVEVQRALTARVWPEGASMATPHGIAYRRAAAWR